MQANALSHLSDHSILVVEDNATSRQLVALLLNSLGFQKIMVAEDGQHGLEFMYDDEHQPDIILCDWQMPNMNGLEFLSAVRAKGSNALFIMVTTTNTEEAALLAKEHGADGYLLKPVKRESLMKVIEDAVVRRHRIGAI